MTGDTEIRSLLLRGLLKQMGTALRLAETMREQIAEALEIPCEGEGEGANEHMTADLEALRLLIRMSDDLAAGREPDPADALALREWLRARLPDEDDE
jgi:hypothetical protein